MTQRSLITVIGVACGLAACDTAIPTAPDRLDAEPVSLAQQASGPDRATGRGLLDFGGGLLVDFSFRAIRSGPDFDARGELAFSVELSGQLVEFHGRTTCLAVDPAEGRAWIGGVITRNNSAHPSWRGEIHQPGKDIWFRVLDLGEGPEPDRSTFVGFEGGGGIITSLEYCEAQIWPDDNARTVPQASGNIAVGG